MSDNPFFDAFVLAIGKDAEKEPIKGMIAERRCLEVKLARQRLTLQAAEALLDALNPQIESGLSPGETASLFNSTYAVIREALESN